MILDSLEYRMRDGVLLGVMIREVFLEVVGLSWVYIEKKEGSLVEENSISKRVELRICLCF